MKKIADTRCLAPFLLCLTLAGCVTPQRPELPSDGTANFQRLEQRLEALRIRWRVPGMSAVVARDGTNLWAHGFGEADVAAHRAATPETVYHLASLTKPFAATVLLQMVQQGRLSLDAPVSDYGVELKSQGVIRVRHLLTHTSEGIPGESYRYNGTRFGSLDKVLTALTARSFATEVGERILDPLGLTNTCPNPHSVESCAEAGRQATEFRRRLAQGYAPDGATPVEYKRHFVTAAGLVSTVDDVARFSAALDEDRLLGPEMRHLMFTPATTASGESLPYGIGWFVQDWRGTRLAWHYGWWVGDSSLMIKVPEHRLTFVLLANSDGLSRTFDLGKDNDVRRSPFARAFLDSFDGVR